MITKAGKFLQRLANDFIGGGLNNAHLCAAGLRTFNVIFYWDALARAEFQDVLLVILEGDTIAKGRVAGSRIMGAIMLYDGGEVLGGVIRILFKGFICIVTTSIFEMIPSLPRLG